MSGILDLLNSDLGKQLIGSASKEIGETPEKTSSAITSALPLLLGAMKNNVASAEGASGLLGALTGGKHDGSILDNLGSLAGNSDVLKDGAGILGHVFGGKEQNIAKAVGAKSGISLGSAANLLKMVAPVIMGFLGKQTRESNVTDASGISNVLGSLLGGSANKEQSLVTQLLDADGDGSVIDDIIGMATKGKKGGLGGLLGGLFGR